MRRSAPWPASRAASTSTPRAAENVDVNIEQGGGSKRFHLRWRIQEHGDISGLSTDDWQLQYNKNSGGWNDVAAASSNILSDPDSGLVDNSGTTNRATNGISDGTGSFVIGEEEEGDGLFENRQLTASNFTEHVWAVKTADGDLSVGDTIDFRIQINGIDFSHTVVPTITLIADTDPWWQDVIDERVIIYLGHAVGHRGSPSSPAGNSVSTRIAWDDSRFKHEAEDRQSEDFWSS